MQTQTTTALRRLGTIDVPRLQAEVTDLRQRLQVAESLLSLVQTLAAVPQVLQPLPAETEPAAPVITPREPVAPAVSVPRTPDALPSGVVRSHKDVLPATPELIGTVAKQGQRLQKRLETMVDEFVAEPLPTLPPAGTPIAVAPRLVPTKLGGNSPGKFSPAYRPSVDPLDPPERVASLNPPDVILPPPTREDLRHAMIKQYTLPSEVTCNRVKLPERPTGARGRGISLGNRRLIQQIVLYLEYAGVSKVRAICDTVGCKPPWAYKVLHDYPQLFQQAPLSRGWMLTTAAKQQLADTAG